jgi:hypothetical protein
VDAGRQDCLSLFCRRRFESLDNRAGRQPDGALEPKPFTSLKNYSLTDFAFSADKKYLALAQIVRLSDVVFITEVK